MSIMDPHSRLSQFNHRTPKSGPVSSVNRFMDPQPKVTLEKFTKRSSSKPSPANTSSLFTQRPIATNSRVKQDEKYKKDLYLAFVNDALQQKLNGRSEAFDQLVDQFNPKNIAGDGAVPSAQLRLWIVALSHVLSRLERRHSALVEAIVNMPWTTMDTVFVKSYTVFIGMLLSARPEYLSLVLGKIAQDLTYRHPESSSGPLTRRVIYDRLHYLLQHLLSLIPTLPSTLQPLLVRNFPHKRQPQVAQVAYIRNLLRVTEYCPELADRILATIIDRAIQVDVEIQVELEELEEEDPQDHDEIFELDPFDTVVGQEGDDEPESESDGEDGFDDLSDLSSDDGDAEETGNPDIHRDAKHIHDMVNKLDAILKLIFDHFNRLHAAAAAPATATATSPFPSSPATPRFTSPPSALDMPDFPASPAPLSFERGRALRRSQFHTLLSIFDRTIIRTFKSRYTQFLIFWYSSLDPEFSDLFQGMLVEKALLTQDQPAVTRAAAASYIASFVSRAQFVDRDGTRRVMSVLCTFLQSHLDAFDVILQTGQELPSVAHHSVFYAVTQAVFLIFCFRWRDLQEDEGDVDESLGTASSGKKWMPELSIVQRVLTSLLNPLKVCSSNVVMQFARVAQATDFAYCYSILEVNKRSDYNPTPGQRSRATIDGESLNAELNTFFPFDPYRLPKSSPYIQGVYREWSSVAIDEDDDEDDDDDDDGDEEEEDIYDIYSDSLKSAEDNNHGLTRSGHLAIPKPEPLQNLSDADGLGESFGGMSISPAQPKIPVLLVS
ncbi:hypothetical protein SERLA73DRAFT_159088 [Serpula lacrymans var. lacrymans S7.3]|uniref:RNA polymerase I-specific transcription initiation factor RRN3 n=2 Tax=Serpula lacrymans var. lacrymans TaxID=341189 RepID=F8PPB5_SERL3|nr:uncharacterized protein SERLADRAFT_413954 [Serpula lacrymans var. lacrymans S7.9]EGO01992.1 hypothetical protein SERLA73DRAFT_159088 [Serpula lacrymans var. lacrymans S7.3]EGO27616.1 hypothetical protein SERLADRAFT_413954 [Serpula lacrymans var. lacrymans S7.9]